MYASYMPALPSSAVNIRCTVSRKDLGIRACCAVFYSKV